jgi:hypothetical protein
MRREFRNDLRSATAAAERSTRKEIIRGVF